MNNNVRADRDVRANKDIVRDRAGGIDLGRACFAPINEIIALRIKFIIK